MSDEERAKTFLNDCGPGDKIAESLPPASPALEALVERCMRLLDRQKQRHQNVR